MARAFRVRIDLLLLAGRIFRSMITAHASPLAPSRSAFDLLLRDTSRAGIVTSCEALDQMLGGGVPLGKITEFCAPFPAFSCCLSLILLGGAPGIGKTQIGYVKGERDCY